MSYCSFADLKKSLFLLSCLMLIGVNLAVPYEPVKCAVGGFECDEISLDLDRCNQDRLGTGAAKWSCPIVCGVCQPCPPNSNISSCGENSLCQQTSPGAYNCSCKSGYSGGFNCTDIDECATGQHQCSVNADCTNTIGNYTCQCKFGYFGNGTTCDDGSNRIVCNESSMTLYLDNRTQLYNGSLITLNDTSCTAKYYPQNNEYRLVTAYDKCGTTRRETSTHIIYENEVTWTLGNTSAAVFRATGRKTKFVCTFITATEVGHGTFTVSLSMYQNSTFSTPPNIFPVAVRLDQRLYFEVQVGTRDTSLVLLIEKCSATPTTDKNHASSYDLIKDRCATDTTVQFISATPSHKMRFSFVSFKFYMYAQVYLHCQILMCGMQSSDSRCISGCQGNNIKRNRRSISLESEEAGLKPWGRKDSEEQEVKNPLLSNTYNLNIGPFVESKNTLTENRKPRDVKSWFSFTHGMVLLSAVLAIGIGFFVTKEIVEKTGGGEKKQQDGFKKRQENFNEVF